MTSLKFKDLQKSECCQVYSDSCFSVLRHGRLGDQLQVKVLEAELQRIHKPDICVQKESVIFLKLFNQYNVVFVWPCWARILSLVLFHTC